MADSETSIANSALMKLGADRILTLTDNKKTAIVINEQFAKVRDRVLRGHPWNFAIKREALALEGTTPTTGYSYQFTLPNSCLRVLAVTNSTDDLDLADYRIEQRKVLTTDNVCYLKYIEKITDVTQFDSAFDEAFACALAAEVGYAITQNANVVAQMQALYKEAIREARGIDAFEDQIEAIDNDSWIRERA